VFVEGGHYSPVFSIFDFRLKERHLNELLFLCVLADLEFVERSLIFAHDEQYSEQDYKYGAEQVEEQVATALRQRKAAGCGRHAQSCCGLISALYAFPKPAG
jgi:hypothetical protein